jgi:hypothetical protein
MASRIDFLAGGGPFVLTPFLVLSPVILGVELTRAWMGRAEIRLPPGTARYLLATTALFVVLLASTFLSYELAVSARRLALLVVQAYMVFLVGLALANRPDVGRILLRGAYFGLIAVALLNAVQAVVFVAEPAWARSAAVVIDLEPGTYFGVVPRLTGVSHDPNHGGLFVVFLLWLVTRLAPPSRARALFVALSVLSVAATLSRSAVLAGLILWAATHLAGRELRLTVRTIWLVAGGAVTATLAYFAFPDILEPIERLGSMLSSRLTLEEGSSSDHVRLLELGWEVATENLRHLVLGIGYGSAFMVTQDIFPGNEYGNFHSLFMTLFVEAGVVAMGLGVWLFVEAIRVGGDVRPMIVALLAFNLFQQTHTEPILWLCLMMAWVPLESSEGGQSSRPPEAFDARVPAPFRRPESPSVPVVHT